MSVRGRLLAVVVAGSLVAGCGGSGPVSEVSTLPPTAAPESSAPGASGPPSEPPGSAEAPPGPTPTPPPAVEPPPKPGKPTFELLSETPANDTGTTTSTYRITWTSPEGAATSFLAYGLTECLRYAKKYDGKPCVVRGMRIPRDKLVLLGEVPGDARSMDVSWETGEAGPPPYAAILLRAANAAGDSIFTIAHSETVCFGCVY